MMQKGDFLCRPGPVREVCTRVHTQVLAHTAAHVLLLLPVYFLARFFFFPFNIKDSLLYASPSCSLLSSHLSPECQNPFRKPHVWGDGVRGTKPPRQLHQPAKPHLEEEGRPFSQGANRKLPGTLMMPLSVSRRTSHFQRT